MKEDFKYIRRKNRILVFVNICLSLLLIYIVNLIASKYYLHKDLTEEGTFSLSPESLAYLKKLEVPVEIILLFPSEPEQPDLGHVYKMIGRLAEAYVNALPAKQRDKIKIEKVDPFKENKRVQEIAAKFGAQKENLIIVASKGRYKQIYLTDMLVLDESKVVGFKGEQLITSAILEVTRLKSDKLYFLAGHGEMSLSSSDARRGLSEVAHFLKKQNYDLEEIDLSAVNEIPKDASLLVLVSPQTPLLEKEMLLLKHYLTKKNGAMLVFLDPYKEHGLEELFYDWGVLAERRVLRDEGKDFQVTTGDLIIRRFGKHPLTEMLVNYKLPIAIGLSRPIRQDLGRALDPRVSIVPLLASSQTSWAQAENRALKNSPFDRSKDIKGPLTLGLLAERKMHAYWGMELSCGRLMVYGNGDFISNHKLSLLGNRMLLKSSICWMLGKNEVLNLPPEQLKKYQLPLSQNNLFQIILGMFVLPGSLACLGLLIFIIRRR